VDLYESEARKSASAEAYYAANAMLGSASEARILLECPRQPAKIRAIIRDLPKGKQPRSSNPLDWSLNDLIEIATRAGWLACDTKFLAPWSPVLDRPHAHFGKEE
jgi:hypothetical protein